MEGGPSVCHVIFITVVTESVTNRDKGFFLL